MAQLRDAQTSELIAEGTPQEIARIAAGFDVSEVLFDDVGSVDHDGLSVFRPADVRQVLDDEIAGLDALIAKPNGGGKVELRAAAKERRDRIAAAEARQSQTRQRMEAARARVRR